MAAQRSPTRLSAFRRSLDVVAAAAALVVLAPLLAAIAVLVRAASPGPVLFRQTRLTRGRHEFTIYKFRTMRVSAGGPEVTVRGDVRITPVGAFLRRTSLDELPQLVNVLRGEMTLVGPRPETPALGAKYPAECQWVLEQTPGLTGPTQLRLRDGTTLPVGVADPERWYIERLVPARVAMDLTYLRNPTAAATVHVLLETARYLTTGGSPGGPPDATPVGHTAH